MDTKNEKQIENEKLNLSETELMLSRRKKRRKTGW